MTRKLFTFALALLTAASAWAYDFKSGDLYYNITNASNKTVEVTYEYELDPSNYSSLPGAVSIPETVSYNGINYSVTSIGNSAFYYCSALTQVNIPESVTSIGNSAFESCYKLTQVTIPDGVTSIGNSAFSYCYALTQVSIPNGVTNIGEGAFSICLALTAINVEGSNTTYCSENGILFNKGKTTLVCYPAGKPETVYAIPNSVTSIGSSAFFGCSRLTQVNIPDGVKSIGDGAFFGSFALTQVDIPNSVTSIGDYAFAECSALIDINVGSGNTTYCSENSVLFNKDKTTLVCYPADKPETVYAIPNSVTSIGDWAFFRCSRLTQVNIPSSVTSIGSQAFQHCDALTQVNIPSSVTSIGDWAFAYCSKLRQMNIPGSVTSIGEWVFYGCSSLTQVTIPESVTSIGQWAFTQVTWNAINCNSNAPCYDISSNITNFIFGNQVEHIPAYLCYGMDKLTQVTLPESVTSIGEWVFYGCSSLTQVTIPESVTSIGQWAFRSPVATHSSKWLGMP